MLYSVLAWVAERQYHVPLSVYFVHFSYFMFTLCAKW